MKSLGAQAATGKKIPVEGFEMPQIEDQPVAFRDWPGINRIRRNRLKQFIGLSACFDEFTPKDWISHSLD